MPELSEEELDTLAEQAIVDAYNDEEQLGGFAVMIEDNLETLDLAFDSTAEIRAPGHLVEHLSSGFPVFLVTGGI